MAIQFKGFTTYQTPEQSTLLCGQMTWAVSLFFELDPVSSLGADTLIDHSSFLASLSPGDTTQGQALIGCGPMSNYQDQSKLAVWAGAYDGHNFAGAGIKDVNPFVPHHLVFAPDITSNPSGAHTLKIWLDGMPTGYVMEYYVGPIATLPWTLAIGNPDWGLTVPGPVTFSIENVAIWHGGVTHWVPSQSDVIALRDKTKTPKQVGPTGALQAWWTLQGSPGTTPGGAGDQGLVNQANPGILNLTPA